MRAGTAEPSVGALRRAMSGTVHVAATRRRGESPSLSAVADEQDDPRALPWTRVGAYAICTDAESRMLVCRLAPGYPSTGAWTLPGGGVEFGEHPDAAVVRELREETGLEGAIERVAKVASSTFPRPSSRPGPLHAIAILYRVRITGGALTVEVGGSTDACEWMTVGAIHASERVSLVDTALDWLALEESTAVGKPHRQR